MTVMKLAISLERELALQIKRSAAGEPVSTWLADAARRKLRSQGMLAAVKLWELEHGELTKAELAAAAKEIKDAAREHKRRTKKARL